MIRGTFLLYAGSMRLQPAFVPVLFAAAVSIAAAQAPSLTRSKDVDTSKLVTETKHLKLSASAAPKAAAPSARVSLFVDVEPKPKMHVYAPDQKEYIPIALTLTADEAFKPQPIRFPPAEKYFFAPLKETQLVFSKPFRIEQPVTLSAKVAATDLTIKGTVRYQACDDAICYIPQNVPVSWTIKVNK
jgi:DsbC/DsbD-like thiol-disulfide interchange protein